MHWAYRYLVAYLSLSASAVRICTRVRLYGTAHRHLDDECGRSWVYPSGFIRIKKVMGSAVQSVTGVPLGKKVASMPALLPETRVYHQLERRNEVGNKA